MKNIILISLLTFFIITAFLVAPKPTLYIIGDSTVNNTNAGFMGWGNKIASLFDTTKINIVNHAKVDRSTRTFIKEKRWAKVDSLLKLGDFVMMQFGHNEGSIPDTNKAGYRGVLREIGEETKKLTSQNEEVEFVDTYY